MSSTNSTSTSSTSTSSTSTSPASTSPASTSPASTSPASTSPASTSPASTSPASIIGVSFEHIYNGIIFGSDNNYFPMIEFKIIQKNLSETKKKALFKYVDYKCAWFIIDINADINENSQTMIIHKGKRLLGPIKIDSEKILTGKRVINDINFPEINNYEITGISNDVCDLIASEDIPSWMSSLLKESVYLS
jgi:hypothetical protein